MALSSLVTNSNRLLKLCLCPPGTCSRAIWASRAGSHVDKNSNGPHSVWRWINDKAHSQVPAPLKWVVTLMGWPSSSIGQMPAFSAYFSAKIFADFIKATRFVAASSNVCFSWHYIVTAKCSTSTQTKNVYGKCMKKQSHHFWDGSCKHVINQQPVPAQEVFQCRLPLLQNRGLIMLQMWIQYPSSNKLKSNYLPSFLFPCKPHVQIAILEHALHELIKNTSASYVQLGRPLHRRPSWR